MNLILLIEPYTLPCTKLLTALSALPLCPLSFRFVHLILPIGAMFATTLWFGNTAYLYISISFAQMLKAGSKPPCLLASFSPSLPPLSFLGAHSSLCLWWSAYEGF